MESDDSDKKSKMSFSYWGADRVTVQKPVLPGKGRIAVAHPRRGGSPAYARESSANAKFGSRLVSDGSSTSSGPRPASRRAATPSRGEYGPRSTSTKPEWNTSTRNPATGKNARARSTSQTSGTPAVRTPANGSATKLASPAPSEDSGVGLYRQMLAKDPSLNQT